MYQNIYIQKSKQGNIVHLWDDKAGYTKFKYVNYAYMKHPAGSFYSLYGDKLKRVSYWTGDDLKAGKIFESDVPLETKVLLDKYLESDEPSTGHREIIIDIEVESSKGFPSPQKAENEVTAIALYDKVADKYTCLILGSVKPKNQDNVIIESFQTETELLQRFYQMYLEINPTIITGWNTNGFDIPYLYNRTKRVMGEQVANCLSPIGDVYYNEHRKRYMIGGVSQLDYLALYKEFTFTQQSSYRLDYIGNLEVGLGKIDYEGSLQDLYETDIDKFIEYNLNDVKIVKKLDDKLKFIELVRGIAHLGHIPYEDIFFSSRWLEGALLAYLRKLEVVAPNKPNNDYSSERFAGAYVKDPKPGRYNWVYDLDLTSMYPSIIMSLNVSPETKIGKVTGWNAEEFIKGTKKTYTIVVGGKPQDTLNETELKGLLDSKNISISSNGILYRNDKKGLIPSILRKWFDERVEYKRLAKKYFRENDLVQHEYYNRRQHIQKIVLNSLYGVLGLPVFRFYDVDNAEATTVTGQELIKYTQRMTNFFYNNELGDKKDHIIYTDTDSIFCTAVPLVKHRNPSANIDDDEYMTKEILSITQEVQDFVNNSYDLFGKKFLNINEHRFDIKQEVIARSAFWVAKKRYGQWIINDGGLECNKLDVKGLDIVRSSFPPSFKKVMTTVLTSILNGEDKKDIDKMIIDFKKSLPELDISDLAIPTGVKGIDKYIDKQSRRGGQFTKSKYGQTFSDIRKGAPVHVKAAIAYNDLLKVYGVDDKFVKIKNYEKIKWVYLKRNPYNIQTLAFKGYEDPKEVLKFVEDYVDRDKLYEGQLQKKIDMFYGALRWDKPTDSETTIERFF